MPEILVISGKGGTGKTSLTAAFAHLAGSAIICDLDVDAPDLHLLLHPSSMVTQEFYSGHVASIQPHLCGGCETCIQMCRYDAIEPGSPAPVVDPFKCEGCKVCVAFCPDNAIDFTSKHCGARYQSDTRFGPMVHAQLFPGEENSGRLVAVLRQEAKAMAKTQGQSLILSDGPPGIGCPVISAISGVDLAVIVTEPTPSGLHDLERIVSLCDYFNIPVAVVINKSDLNAAIAQKIESSCFRRNCSVVAKLSHDKQFVHAMVQGQAITEYTAGRICQQISQAWEDILSLANGCHSEMKVEKQCS
jgi:MinD superfamily P-loop ATPase